MKKKIYINTSSKEEKLFALHYLAKIMNLPVSAPILSATLYGTGVNGYPLVACYGGILISSYSSVIEERGVKSIIVPYSEIHTIQELLKEETVKVELNDQHTAEYTAGEDFIQVGCQKIAVSKLDELVLKIKEANKSL